MRSGFTVGRRRAGGLTPPLDAGSGSDRAPPPRVHKAVGGLAVVAVYAVAMVAVVAVHFRAETTVFDERDEAIAEEAAQLTLTVFGWASAAVFPAPTAAWGLGYFEWGPATSAVALSVTVLYLTYAALLFAFQRRR